MFDKYATSVYRAKPAYGRSYACQAEAMYDFENGKDFRMLDGTYFSNRDVPQMLQDVKYELSTGYDYLIKVFFWSTTREEYDFFFVNNKGVCVLSI
jgi:hypothetical protein